MIKYKYSLLITHLLLTTFLAPLFAKDKVADRINTFRKNRGVANEIVADSIMSIACRVVLQKEEVKKLPKAGGILAIKEFLEREHIYDAQCALLEVTGATLDDAFSEDSIVRNIEHRSVFSDEEFNRIGYLETAEDGEMKVHCFLSKRFVQFSKWFRVEGMHGPSITIEHVTISGKSFIDEIYFSEGFYQDILPRNSTNQKPMPLRSDKSFSITVEVRPGLPNTVNGIAIYDKRDRLIAFVKI